MKEQTIEMMRDFVRGCISFNPNDRPSIDEVLQHKLFGGPKLFPQKKNDAWISKASSKKVQFLLSLYVGCAASLQLPSSSHPVSEFNDVGESKETCTPENPVDMKEDDVLPVAKKKTSILKSFRDWIKKKWDKYSSRKVE